MAIQQIKKRMETMWNEEMKVFIKKKKKYSILMATVMHYNFHIYVTTETQWPTTDSWYELFILKFVFISIER